MSVNKTVRMPGSRSSGLPPGMRTAPKGFTSVPPRNRFRDLGLDLDEFFRHQAMRFTVDFLGRLRVGSMDQAKDFSATLIAPILEILDAVLPLYLHISGVRLSDVLGGHMPKLVNVHV